MIFFNAQNAFIAKLPCHMMKSLFNQLMEDQTLISSDQNQSYLIYRQMVDLNKKHFLNKIKKDEGKFNIYYMSNISFLG